MASYRIHADRRAKRISDELIRLTNRGSVDIPDMKTLQSDVHSPLADNLLPILSGNTTFCQTPIALRPKNLGFDAFLHGRIFFGTLRLQAMPHCPTHHDGVRITVIEAVLYGQTLQGARNERTVIDLTDRTGIA